MSTATVSVLVTLQDMGACYVCGTRFAAETSFVHNRVRDHKSFYCPNGHSQVYSGETVEARLTRELESEKLRRRGAEDLAARRGKERDAAELQTRMARGKLKALKGRVKNGVCPCCQRSFAQLAKHMATEHPDYTANDNAAGDAGKSA